MNSNWFASQYKCYCDVNRLTKKLTKFFNSIVEMFCCPLSCKTGDVEKLAYIFCMISTLRVLSFYKTCMSLSWHGKEVTIFRPFQFFYFKENVLISNSSFISNCSVWFKKIIGREKFAVFN